MIRVTCDRVRALRFPGRRRPRWPAGRRYSVPLAVGTGTSELQSGAREPRSESGWGWRPPGRRARTPTRPAGAVTCQHARQRASPRAPPPPGAESESQAPAAGPPGPPVAAVTLKLSLQRCQCQRARLVNPGGAAERPACQPARVAMPGGRASARPGGRHLRLEVSSRESRAAGTGRPQPWRLRLFATCADVGFRMPQPAGPFMIRSKAAVHFLPALAARSLAADVVAATEIQPSSMGYHGHARRQDNRRNQVRCAETGRTSTTKCYSEVNGT
jgi:hypothetical protein